MPKNSQPYRDRRDIPQNSDEQDPRIRYAVDFFGNGDNVTYRGNPIDAIFGKKPDAYKDELYYKEFPMHFAANSPDMEALNSLVQYMNPNKGLVFRESFNPVADRDRIAGNPSRVVTYNSRSSRGAGTRKRMYKNDDEENDPRKRGKNFVENVKSGLRSAYNFVANPVKDVAANAPRQARAIYESGKSGGKKVHVKGNDPLSRFAQTGINTIYNAGKVVRSAENASEDTRRKVDFANRAVREAPRVISDMYEGGRTGKKPRTYALGEDLIRNIAGIHGFLQGVNEGIRGSGEKSNTKKRASTVQKKATRQGGFVNGRPVSLKKRANTSMKYFK